MNMAIVRVELRLMIRERLFLVIAGVFLFLTLCSGLIGWSTSATINHGYALSVPLMQHGAPIAPNPFAHVSHLSLQRNIGVYFFLIGSLLAIILGYSATMRDRTSGVLSLVLSRPLSKEMYMIGKMVSVGVALGLVLLCGLGASMLLTSLLPELRLDGGQIAKLLLFYGISWVYLVSFALLGLACGLLAKSRTMALLLPVAFWVVIGFVIPQVVSGTEPVALLNPVTIATSDTPTQSGFFTFMNTTFGPLSFPEQYKQLSVSLLEFQPTPVSPVAYVSVFTALFVVAVGVWWAVRRYEPSERLNS